MPVSGPLFALTDESGLNPQGLLLNHGMGFMVAENNCCCDDPCCSEIIAVSGAFCDGGVECNAMFPDLPGGCGISVPFGICLQSFSFDEATGNWSITILTTTGFTEEDGLCVGVTTPGSCSLGAVEITAASPDSEINPQLTLDEHIACAYVSVFPAEIPSGSTATFSGTTNFPSVVPDQCCTYRFIAVLLNFGVTLLDIEWGEVPC